MFFVIPEMPSKTFVMLYKKIPDHFNILLASEHSLYTYAMMRAFIPSIWTIIVSITYMLSVYRVSIVYDLGIKYLTGLTQMMI